MPMTKLGLGSDKDGWYTVGMTQQVLQSDIGTRLKQLMRSGLYDQARSSRWSLA